MEKKEEILRVRNLDISFETTAEWSIRPGRQPDGKPGRDGCNRWGIRFR